MGRLKTLKDWLDWQNKLHHKEIDLSLDRLFVIYKKLFKNGVPFAVISVAGTNGKGSTIAFIDSIYQQSDFKVGAFTSPHLIKYNERFRINGKLVSDEDICDAFSVIEKLRGEISLTYFEFSTLAALIIFAKMNVDIAILEVGMGGRLDAVNIVDADVSIITNIAIDHTEYLGNNREKIGFEKAGIMRKNKPCLYGNDDIPNSIKFHAKEINAKLIFVNNIYTGKINLKGEHQRNNAALAIKAVEQMQALLAITKKQIKTGIEKANLLARMQTITINNKQIVLDVAHNESAVKTLSSTLKKDNVASLAIFAALADKDISSMIEQIDNLVDKWLLVPIYADRAIPTNKLIKKFSINTKVSICQSMQEAILQAINCKNIDRIIILGSFYTVADAIKIIDNLKQNVL